jgi:hypothetical protein
MHPFHPSETLTIRMAASADAGALRQPRPARFGAHACPRANADR